MEIESEDKPPGSPLIRDFDMGNYLGRSNFFIKYEGVNPTGRKMIMIDNNGTVAMLFVHNGNFKITKNEIDKIPKFIAASTVAGNPVIYSYINRFRNIVELDQEISHVKIPD